MDPYRAEILPKNPNWKRRLIEGRVVAILDMKLESRELSLEVYPSRCVLKNGIHEFILTDEKEACPGGKVNRISYLCFTEITKGGVVLLGDEIFIGGKKVGDLVGFDETHLPNHLNIIVYSLKRVTGVDLGLNIGDKILIKGRRK
jgi:hypothetical protein